jgi:Outer membrane protein beta-barrel family/Carboxypeptidase regulatory-like domain
MQKISVLLAALLLFYCNAFSQTATITGTISDGSEKKPVYNSVVALLSPVDSFLYKFTRTDANGNFTIKNAAPGNYILMTAHALYADYTDSIRIKDGETNLGTISLLNKSKLLQDVIIKSGSAIRIKGDTTIYTADSFRVSANANVEELLKKLPGIQVDKNGEIKAMGEKVTKVLVDGEEFFGDDPGMAVKNLRADAVKEVQVFDKKSDQAEFTGIDDGDTKKTINLKLKDNKKSGYFGKIDASGGPQKIIDDRYNTNLLFSSFKGKRKLSAFVLNGNTGQDRLSWQDSEKFGGENENVSMNMDDDGEVSFQWTGGNNDDEPYVDNENGFMRNTNAGLQYSNKWNDKQTLNLTPKYNSQIYTNNNTRFTQNQYGDSVLNENANTSTNVNRNNFKFSATYDVKLDSNNTIKFTTKTNFYNTISNEIENASTTGNKGILKNSSDRIFNTNSNKESYFGSVLYKHKFKKARRTFSINSSWNLLNSEGNSFLNSTNISYKNGDTSSIQKLNQNKISDKLNQNISANVVYTEPLSKKHSLEISYQITSTKGTNNQLTYSYSNLTDKYDYFVDSLSNQFRQVITINKPSLKINYNSKKIKYNFGSGFGFTNFDLLDKTFNKDYKRNFTNFFPAASFIYTYKSNHSLRLNYNGNTSQPSLNDLQPLRNNANFFNQFIGNPDLKPSFTNSFRVSHNSYNFLKELNTYQSINIRTVSNAISYSKVTDLDSGKTITKPINTNGNFSINFYGGTWFKIKKIDLQVGVNPNMSFNKFVNVINNKNSFSKTLNSGLSLYLSKYKEKKYDFSINNNFSNNRNTTTQNNQIKKFNTYNLSIDATVYYKKTWSLSSDYNYFLRQKTPDFQTNLSNQLWNAKLQKTFKKDEFTAYITIRDILNQNIGIDRRFDDISVSEVRNDRLKRYAMIGFTWNFKNKTAVASK